MKNCISCSAQLEETATFCGLCGTKQDDAASTVAPPSYQTPVQPAYSPAPAPANVNSYSSFQEPSTSSNARGIVLKHGSSPLFLIAIIILAVNGLLMLILNILLTSSPLALSAIMAPLFDLGLSPDMLDRVVRLSTTYFNSAAIGAAIPLALNVVGMVLFYRACKKQSNSTVGLTLLRVMSIFSLVSIVSILLLTLILLYSIILSLFQISIAAKLIIAFVVILIFALPIYFAVSVVTTISKVRKTFKTGEPLRTSKFLPIMLIVSSIFAILISVLDLSISFEALASCVSCVVNIIIATRLFAYNRDIDFEIYQNASANARTHSNLEI